MRVLGLDPGLRKTGWGVVDVEGTALKHVANGVVAPKGEELAERLAALFEGLREVVKEHAPQTAAVEQTFVNKDPAGALKLGHARAISLLISSLQGLSVAEYAATTVKKSVVGVGRADKTQIAHMVGVLLPGVKIAGPDAADALAVAICHAYQSGGRGRIEAAIAKGRNR